MEQHTKQAILLVVDDEENNRKLLEAILTAEGHAIHSASSGEEALSSVAKELPDLILLDIMMPGLDGYQVLHRLKADQLTSSIPVILITVLEDRESRLKGLEGGAAEFISKPVDRAELILRVRNLLLVKEYQDFLSIHNAELDNHIQWLAHFDELTGLPNKATLVDQSHIIFSMSQRRHSQLAVLILDIDHFKNVNDKYGSYIGDKLLKEVASCIKLLMRKQDMISRQGGDEFILLLPDADSYGTINLAEKLLEKFSKPFKVEQHELAITISIGIALYPDNGEDFELLLKNANIAMYRAKSKGRNNYCFVTQEMQEHVARTIQLETALSQALKHDQMYLNYQPQISLSDGRIIGMEALLRWHHPELGLISPAEFIPIAESGGHIFGIGKWVLRTAVQQLKIWMDKGLQPLILAVNLSSVQINHPDLPALITEILDEAKVPPQYLELELTEGAAMINPLEAIKIMNDFTKLGINLSIDDFGTGFSSMSYLKKFQLNKLKIDQSFICNIADGQEDKAIVIAIINMAHNLGLEVIAEGVETEDQLTFLRENGCDEIQGYYYSKPLLADQFELFVREWPPAVS